MIVLKFCKFSINKRSGPGDGCNEELQYRISSKMEVFPSKTMPKI